MQATAGALRREVQVIGLVGFAHLLSHLYMWALIPLYPQITADLGISYTQIGIAVSVFAAFTGGFQTPMGFLVNRIGARTVLIGGLFVNAVAIGLVGFATTFWELLALMAMAGLGSSVFHPADYSILSSRVTEQRLGRAFSLHTLGGHMGFVIAPPIMVALEAIYDWRTAVMAVGAVGVLMAFAMLTQAGALGEGGQAKEKKKPADSWRRLVTSRPIMLFFVFYIGSSAANAGVVHFSVTAFSTIYGIDKAASVAAMTAYTTLALLTVLPGGWLADRVKEHDLLLAGCFGGAALMVVLCGLGVLPFWLVVLLMGIAGGLRGLVNASRDVSVRRAAGDVSVGTAFAFVTTGFSLGQMTGPAIYGFLVDIGSPEIVFWASAGFSLISISTIFLGRMGRPRPALAE